MVENRYTLELKSIDPSFKQPDSRARSHRLSEKTEQSEKVPVLSRCKSQEKGIFIHDHFTHSRIIKASHDIPHPAIEPHEHKHLHEDHSRTIVINTRVVPENFLLDSFPE